MEIYKKLENFSTADAEDLQVNFSAGQLTVSFTDWQEKNIVLKFNNVLAYRTGPFFGNAPSQDTAYEVTNSTWVSENEQAFKDLALNEFSVPAADFANKFRHYKLCFNDLEIAVDVIAEPYI